MPASAACESSGTAAGARSAAISSSSSRSGDRRRLVEATSWGALSGAVAGLLRQAQAKAKVQAAAEQGFLHGLNEILLLGALLSFAGAVAALWMVREGDIEREEVVKGAPLKAEPEPEPAGA